VLLLITYQEKTQVRNMRTEKAEIKNILWEAEIFNNVKGGEKEWNW